MIEQLREWPREVWILTLMACVVVIWLNIAVEMSRAEGRGRVPRAVRRHDVVGIMRVVYAGDMR